CKAGRPPNVTVNLAGPDVAARYTVSGAVQPGVYPFTWTGRRADGTADAEGLYRWVVTATDDQGQSSTMERDFTIDETLGFAKPSGRALGVPRVNPRTVATFQLTRSATVTGRIETTAGVVLRTLEPAQAEAGPVEVAWDGRTDDGAAVYSG